jgi:purine-binding chemotaxis protein CheW
VSDDVLDLEAPLPPPEPRHLLVRIADVDYAVPVTLVREVVRVEHITRIPDAPPRMRGLTTVHGRLLPVLDAALSLGGAITPVDAAARLVVVECGGRRFGVLVARAGAVIAGTGDAAPLDVDAMGEAA